MLPRIIIAALLPLTIAGVTVASAIASTSTCAHAGQCGECWNTGKAGFNAWKGKVSYCIPCETVAPEQMIAGREGIPGPRLPKRRPGFSDASQA